MVCWMFTYKALSLSPPPSLLPPLPPTVYGYPTTHLFPLTELSEIPLSRTGSAFQNVDLVSCMTWVPLLFRQLHLVFIELRVNEKHGNHSWLSPSTLDAWDCLLAFTSTHSPISTSSGLSPLEPFLGAFVLAKTFSSLLMKMSTSAFVMPMAAAAVR